MKKQIMSVLLAVSMLAGIAAVNVPAAEEEGKVLNVFCWNDEFMRRMRDHFPGYEYIDDENGKIGDVAVKWIVTPNTDNAYQDYLTDYLLNRQESAAADDKVDLFLVEADYALNYVDTPYTLTLESLGITEDQLSEQFAYTQDIVRDSEGNLKGSTWQGCPGLLIYRREIAEKVLGTSDPAEVQEYVKDWDTFKETAALMKENGYLMTSTVNDTYRVFSNNVTSKWVEDGKINIDDSIVAWVELSKAMVDAGQTNTYDLWSEDWGKGFYNDGNVFCYFGPAWFYDFSMAADAPGSVAGEGGWAVTEGPQGFYWGGTWICAADGTDNASLIKDIILSMTADAEVMTGIAVKDGDFVNNAGAMAALAEDESFGDAILGGQNPIGKFLAGIETIDLSNLSEYDQGCNENFQRAMKNYFDGVATYEEALDLFYKNVKVIYPELD